MPPPKKKDEEIDIASLPPWLHVICGFSLNMKRTRAQKLLEKMRATPKSFQRTIHREEIIAYAKEKGLYVDPNALTEKQKKDAKYMESIVGMTELNAKVLAKAFSQMIYESDIQKRKAKKDKLEGKEPPPEKKKEEKKPAPEKDKKGKGGPPVEEKKEEEKQQPEKEYNKAFDILYILLDYPKTLDEVKELSQTSAPLDVLVKCDQKVQLPEPEPPEDIADKNENYEEDFKDRMDGFIDKQPEEEEEKPIDIKLIEEFTEEDKNFVLENQNIINFLREARKQSDKKNLIRNCFILDNTYEVDPLNEEEFLNNYIDNLMEDLCSFSFEIGAHEEFLKTKKVIPLLPSMKEEMKRLAKEAESRPGTSQDHERDDKDKKIASRPGTKPEAKDKKEDKKEQERLEAERKEKEAAAAAAKAAEELKKSKIPPVNPLFYYEKQLNHTETHSMGPGILLEVMIDQIAYDNSTQTKENIFQLKENENDIREIKKFVGFMDQKIMKGFEELKNEANPFENNENDKKTPYKSIINEADEIELRTYKSVLNNLDDITAREKALLSKMSFPGINRYLMPEIPEKSEQIRKAERSQYYPFITCEVSEFERRMMLSKFEGFLHEAEPERTWELSDRIYQERHNRNTLSQTLYKALLFDPNVVARYNERDDNLYLMVYYKNPPGRIFRKKWTAEWRVLPNLENFILYFKNNENNMKNEIFYDLDYEMIGNIYERKKFLFPNDSGVIICTKYKINDEIAIRYKVFKENMVFGIRPSLSLGSQFCEIWCQFNNQTRMLMEMENYNNEYKATLTLTIPNGLIVKFLPNGDIYQCIVKNGKQEFRRHYEDIVSPYDDRSDVSEAESNRIITGKGSVIKYMKDGSIIILYANGNVAVNKRNGLWITTNNKGLRRAKRIKDNHEYEVDPIPCAKRTDPETGCKILIREDKVIIITYKDGSMYTQHRDGTKMFTSASKDIILVENENYATVKVRMDEVKARMSSVIGLGSAFASVGFKDIMERSNNGRVTETYLPENTVVIGYKEKRELPGYNNFVENTLHLVYMDEGTVVKARDDGEVILIGASDRYALNEKGENREKDDIDYFLQLFGIAEERKFGVYTAEMSKNIIWTQDDEGNKFTISSNGDVDAKIAVSFNIKNDQERPATPEFEDGDFIEEENKFLPQPGKWIPPRLFVINNDDTGFELLNKEQLANYFRIKEKDKNCQKIMDDKVNGIAHAQSMAFVTKVVPWSQRKPSFIKVNIPKNIDILPQTMKKAEEPQEKSFMLRNLLFYPEFDQEKREGFKKDLEKYDMWKKNEVKEINEFGIIEKSEEEKEKEFNVQLKIMESRNKQYHQETYDECKVRLIEQLLALDQKAVASQKTQQVQQNKKRVTKKNTQKNSGNIPQEYVDPNKEKEKKDEIPSEMKIETKKEAPIVEKHLETTLSKAPSKHFNVFVTNYFETMQGQMVVKDLAGKPNLDSTKFKEKKLQQEEEMLKQTLTLQGDDLQKTGEHEFPKLKALEKSLQDKNREKQLELENKALGKESLKATKNKDAEPIRPSIFTEIDKKEMEKQMEIQNKAKEYHKMKTPEFDIYGTQREDSKKKTVPCLLRTNPESKINQKYILTESATDKRMKISSLSNRLYLKAPNVNELRNQGLHQTMLATLDKKNVLADIMEKKNLMITSEITDKLKKDILILPEKANFGSLRAGAVYEMIVAVINEDIMAQRINAKLKKNSNFIKIYSTESGLIAPGLVRKIYIRIHASPEILGNYNRSFKIVTKSQKYKIPILANILDEATFDRMELERKEENKKSLLKPYVIEIKPIEVAKKPANTTSYDNDTVSGLGDSLPKIVDKNMKKKF